MLKTTAGAWAFFKADAEPVAADFAQAGVLASVRDYMNRYERGAIEDWAIARAKELAAAGAGFEAAAKKAGLAVKTLGPFPINYGDIAVSMYGQTAPIFKRVESGDSPELSGVSTSEKFFTEAFSVAPGAVGEPFVLGDNILTLKVKEASSAKDDEIASISFYYPYFFQTKASTEVRDIFMKSPALKDNFSQVFFKNFQPAASSQQG